MFKKGTLEGLLVGNLHLLVGEKKDENDLGKGFRLEPIKYERYKGDSSTYYNLYKEGKKVSNKVFRKGGLNNGFQKGDFCMLLVYGDDEIGIGGTWCVINTKGNIIYKQKGALDYPYLQGGIIVVENNIYYNLLTGEEIVRGSKSLKSESFIFVDADTWDKKYEAGIYKINLQTAEIEIFK